MIKLVKDLMYSGLILCEPGASLGKVAALLAEHHVHALIVAESPNEPLGFLPKLPLRPSGRRLCWSLSPEIHVSGKRD